MKFLNWTDGWKTYATVAVGIGTGVAQYYGYHIPGYVDVILGFLGIGTARLAISKQSAKTAEDVAILVSQVLSQITVPPTVTVTAKDGSSTVVAPTPINTTNTIETTTIVNTQPSPKDQTELQEEAETRKLNSQNLAPGKTP